MMCEPCRKPGHKAEMHSPQAGIAEKIIPSTFLFGEGRNEIVIEHQGEQYRLRHTRNGKLILTK